jgi:7-cyano-7-deazaguanine synthase
MTETVLVLHSGGLDSTTCLLDAQSQGCRVYSLGVDYGQRAQVELEYARRQCESRGIHRDVIGLQWTKPRREIPMNRSLDEIRRHSSPAFLPGRNSLFLALGLVQAAGIDATRLVIGINCIDFSGYPDCKPEFLNAFMSMARAANPACPEISAPLLHKSKPEIARLASGLGLRRQDTWSCYRPVGPDDDPKPCGACDACKLHDYAWSNI